MSVHRPDLSRRSRSIRAFGKRSVAGGPVCPHCGSVSGKHYDLRARMTAFPKCSDCRKQFTVKVGTVFEWRICRSRRGLWRSI